MSLGHSPPSKLPTDFRLKLFRGITALLVIQIFVYFVEKEMNRFLKRKKRDDSIVWQDREVRFDSAQKSLKCRKGELQIDILESIEDTKGNNGEKGRLIITNLRIIWISSRQRKLNLSVGYDCVVNLNTQTANSRLRGHTQALYVLTRFGGSRFEFVFTNLVKNNPRLFSSVQAVFKAYQSSRLFRDMKLRAAIVREGEINLLPKEEIVNSVKGVWNLSSDQGNLGTFVVTNIRCVWFSEIAENFNVSIPYLQIRNVRIRNSKFGSAFVIETTRQSGNYVLGFKIDPVSRLEYLHKEVSSIHSLYSNNPNFGIDFEVQDTIPDADTMKIEPVKEEIEIIRDSTVDPLVAYFADGRGKMRDRKIEYNHDLGLAVESLVGGVSVSDLWECRVK